jgi:uncharacterized protein
MNDNFDSERKWLFAVRARRTRDSMRALSLLRGLANNGELAAFREIGNIYEFGGGGVDIDYVAAESWYRRAIYEADDSWGCIALARMHCMGKGSAIDYKKAREYYEMLESSNHPLALFQLGQIHYLGLGVEADAAKAEHYYIRAAAQGHAWAMGILGTIYLRNRKVFRGMYFRAKAIVVGFIIGLKNPKDVRVRTI